uniref:CpcD-like domain-containing protein n=1 Tax=uncultured Synechococcus sp. TaxID=154535 RepID=A0A024CHS7_9SYNE|nr:conserved hypothetical protein [uncultured Synechococcus sp.]
MGPFSNTTFTVKSSIGNGARQMSQRKSIVPFNLLSKNMHLMNQAGLKIEEIKNNNQINNKIQSPKVGVKHSSRKDSAKDIEATPSPKKVTRRQRRKKQG